MESTKNPRYYFDFRKERKSAAKGETAFTPATSLFAALGAALDFVRQMGNGDTAAGRKALVDNAELAAYLNKRQIPGVRAYPTRFTPTESNFKGKRIEGVRFTITNRELFDSTRLGLELAAAVQSLYPGKIDFTLSKRLIGSDDVIRRLQAGEDPRLIQQSFQEPLANFIKLRDQYLLYR